MDHWVDIFLGRTDQNAPVFWNLTFLVGLWMTAFGVFDIFERGTRLIWPVVREHRYSFDLLVLLGLVERQKAERFWEVFFIGLGAVGRTSWRIGIWVMPIGAGLGVWRSSVWPYS